MTAAHELMEALGVPFSDGPRDLNPHSTKSGPGRKYSRGHRKDSPIKPKGAGVGFVQRVVGKTKRDRLFEAFGRRQALKLIKQLRRKAKE